MKNEKKEEEFFHVFGLYSNILILLANIEPVCNRLRLGYFGCHKKTYPFNRTLGSTTAYIISTMILSKTKIQVMVITEPITTG